MRLKGYKAKIVSILLILTMVFSQSTTVFASANPEDAAEPTAPAAIEAPAPAPAPAEKPKAEEPKAQPTDSTVDKASKSEEATEVTEEAKAEENTEAKADTETTAAAEAEETEATTIEAEEEAVRPAQVLKVTAGDGAVITVRAPDGALEDGASVRAKRVNSSSVENAVENAVEAEGHNLVGMKAYDITIINADGKEVQPDKTVKVTISNTGLGSDGENTVYHVAGGNAKKVADVASGNKATFSTPHFSIYAVTDEEVAGKLATYEFYVGDNKVSTQIAKEGEKLVAPEVPTSEGKSFVGWTIDGEVINLDDYTSVGNDQTISVKAKFADSLYVYFYNADGSKIMKTEVVTDHKSHDFSAVTYDAGSTKKVTGFAAAPNGKKNIADAITVPEGETGINVYGIEVEGVWISFDADGGVAVNPEFLNAGEGIKLPTTTKNGYKLDGWYDGNTKVSDGATFTEAKTLKAKWTPQNVNYTINYWQQKPTDAVGAADSAKKYDYVESETKTASAGSTITINNITKTYKGFDKNNNNSTKSVEISGDGTTVVNVYFDRKVVTINYYVYSKNAWKVDSSVQGLYAADLAAGQWRTDRPFHVNRGNSAGSGSLCILLTNFDFETAGYAGNTGNQKATDGTVTVCNFYAANTDRPNTVYYYNEKWDGSFELVGTALSTGTLTFHEKFTGYEPYKFTTSAGKNMTTAAFWTNKDNWSDGTKSSASNVYMASKLKVYKLSYFNYNAVSKTETNIKYTSPLGGYAGYVPAKPDVLPDYYVFKGWYKDPSCTEEFKFNEETMPNANLQVYAKWEPNPTTVTFKVYEGHDSAVELTKEVAVGTKVSKVSPSHPTEDGDYVWEGWKDAAGNWMSEDSEILKPEVLTGQWRYTQKLNVEYKDGIKVVATDDKDYNDGSKAKAIAGLEAEGKYFQGWETETGTVVAPGQEFDVTAAAAGSDKVVTLTALWGDTEQPTTITYDPGNGKGTASTDNLVNNETINLKTISSLGFTAPSDEYYFGGWAKSNGGEIVYADGEKVVVDKEGSANTVYAVWVPKKVIEITANSDELEYNGQEQSVTGFIGEEGLLRKYVPATDEDGTAYKVYGATAEAKGTNVGDYDTITDGSKITVEYANGGDATDKVIVKINPGTLTIYKKAIEVTVDGTTKTDVYDGEEHSNTVTEVTGAPEGVSVTVADTVVAKGTNVGTYTTPITVKDVTVTGADNYDVKVTIGKPVVEIITKKAIEVEVAGTTKYDEYDGQEHSNNVVEVKNVPQGVTVTVDPSVVAKGVNAGEYTKEFTAADVTVTGAENYDVTVKVTAPVKEIITKKKVEIEVAGTTKHDTYDGQEHSNNVVDVKNAPQGVTVTVDSSVVAKGVNAGEYTKEFTARNVNVTGAENYDVTIKVTAPVVEIIDKKPVTVTLEGTTKTDIYNGLEHSNNEVKVTGAPDGVNVAVSKDVVAKGVNVGTYKRPFTEEEVTVTGAENYDVTINITAPVVEIITKNSIEIKVNGTTKTDTYDGQEHSNTVANVTGAPAGVNVTLADTVVAKGVDAKTYTHVITEEEVIVEGADNYNVKITIGDPVVEIIEKAPLNIEVAGTTKHDTYDGQEHSNSDVTVSELPAGVSVAVDESVVAKGIDADTYTKNFTADEVTVTGAENYDVTVTVTAPVVEIIDKAPLNITVAGTTKHDTYDGKEHSNTEVTVSELPAGVRVAVDPSVVAKGIDADTYTKEFTAREVTVTGADNYDVTVTVTAPVVEIIDKAPLTIEVAGTTKTDTYDGQEHSNSKVNVSELPAGVSVAVDPSVVAKGVNADTYTKEFTAKEVAVTGAENYDVTVKVTAPVVEIILQDALVINIDGTTKHDTYDGKEHSNTKVNVSELPEGVTVTLADTVVAKGIDADTYRHAITEEEVTVTGAENYNVVLNIGDPVVEIIDKQPVEIEVAGTTKTDVYDGQKHSNTKVDVTGAPEGVTVTVDETVVAEGIDADTYTKEFTPENVIVTGAKNYDVTVKVTKPVVEIINKAPLNIEVAGTTKHDTYDGKEHSNTEVTVSQLPEGVSVTTKDTVVAKGIDADTYTYNFTPEEVVVTGADNYDVTVKVTAPVVEIIDKKAVEIFVGGTTKTDTYDGQKHSNTEITVDKAPEGVVVTVDETVVAEGINADTYTKEFTPANVIVTGAENYDVTVTVTKPMVEIINKAPLTITVAGTTKTDVYDGKEHSNTEVTVSQLPEGVSVTTKDTVVAKGIDADTYTYNFTPEEVVVAGADNYDVTVEVTAPVVEIITKKPITVEVNGTTKTAVYDGEAHSNSEVVYGDMPEGVAVTLNEGVKAEGIDADTYTRNLTAEDFTVVSANYDVTLAIGDPIVQTITPQKITVSDSGELPYNGEVQTLTIPAEKANGVVSGETLTLTDAGISGQNAGTYTDVNKYSWSVAKADGSDSTGNYTIEVTGQLVITPLPITITADFASKYEGDADPEFTGSITEGELVDENDLGEIKYYRTNDDEEQGTYVDVITAEYTPNDNYVVTVVPNTFVIEDARERMVEVLVTYKVVNGSWNKGGKQDIVHTYNIKIKDIVKLTPPAVGDRPDAGYKAGSWDAVIPETITGDSTDLVFTYTYVPKKGGGGDGDDNDKDDSPKTGDDTPVGLLAALMLSSAFGLGFSLFRRREQE